MGRTMRAVAVVVVLAATGLGGIGPSVAAPLAPGPNVVVNGGFETGTFSGWTTGGATPAVVTTPHTGSFAARLGSTVATNGDSTMQQTVTVPVSATLSFWYQPHCPDTLTYDQEQMQIRSTSNTTLLNVLNVCSNTGVWTQVTQSLAAYANQTVVLWFNSHDDNYPSDPTYTLFDDVSVTGTTAANDFSLSANPASVTVNQAASATSTIATAVTSGTAQSVSFSASGLPAGATASFNPTSVTAGASSTLTITTAANTPAGNSTVTVTGTGTSATHTTTIALTVKGAGSTNVVVNGGFETGTFSGWTTGGATPAVVTTPHTGSFAARLGSTVATNGDSTMQQTVTVPVSATLSFWYQPHCPDTLTYDQEQMQIRSTSNTTLLNVLNVCSNTGVWTQVTQSLAAYANQTVVLWFNSHDDNYPSDPTYTLFDDVSVTGTTAANDFSLSANPASVTVNQAASATSTIATAVTSGTAQSVSFSASGLPAGATASFNPTSVTAGASSTLTITTAANTPAGNSTVTVTGTGTSATHTTTIALTVNGPPPPGLLQISSDPYTDPASEHATQVEPDTLAVGSTLVSAFQVGRFNNGGADNIGWATTTNNGSTWSHGFLPGITTSQGGTWARVSDPSVGYDAKHGVWLIAGLVIDSSASGRGVSVNRSTDGLTWGAPVIAVSTGSSFLDKDWVVCDSTPTSPGYGNCYIEYDNNSASNTIQMLTSTDGGVTWSAPRATADTAHGLGGQPLVQPGGTVVVPYLADGAAQIRAFSSTNGGTTWGASVLISSETDHLAAGGLRTSVLPSAEIDGAGKVFVAWQDCRFRNGCPANDIVFSTSTTGSTWTPAQRVPIDPATSTVDHFIPGLAVDRSTSGASAHLGVYYYYYPTANCSSSCQLDVGFTSSVDGGTTWSAGTQVAGPMTLGQIAATSQGPMVGDYISTSFLNGRAFSVFAVGVPPSGSTYNEAMYTVTGGLHAAGGTRPTDTWSGPLNFAPRQPSRAPVTAY